MYAAVQCANQKATHEAETRRAGEMGGWRMKHNQHADVEDKVMHRELLYHEAEGHLNGEKKGRFKREPLIQFPQEISLHLHTVF